jgi:hypothetical protein
MRELRSIPREAWVAAGLGVVLLIAALFAHTMIAPLGESSPPAPAPPGDTGDLSGSGTGGVEGEGGTTAPAPAFSLSVSPASAAATSGDTVRYRMTVRPEGGFDAPISLSLTASALYGTVGERRDLGVIEPPYDPIAYDFVAPDLPFPVMETTIEATVTATGGGLTRTQDLTLQVMR